MLPISLRGRRTPDVRFTPAAIAAFVCGSTSSLVGALHTGSLLLGAIAASTAPNLLPLALGIALIAIGAVCLRLVPALGRGELDAQKKLLGYAVALLGLGLPSCTAEPLAFAVVLSASASIAALLGSRSEITAPATR